MNFDYDKLIEDIKAAPSYVKENVACYFYHNTQACRTCPKVDECPRREPQPFPSLIGSKPIDPLAVTAYVVPVTQASCVRIPDPHVDYAGFSTVVRDLANGSCVDEIKRRKAMESLVSE